MKAENRFRIRPTEMVECSAGVSHTAVPVREDSICMLLSEHGEKGRHMRINMTPREAAFLASRLLHMANKGGVISLPYPAGLGKGVS